jgi:hypothetical protein
MGADEEIFGLGFAAVITGGFVGSYVTRVGAALGLFAGAEGRCHLSGVSAHAST